MNVTFTKAKLFAIRYSINHATQIQDIAYIIIIVDNTPATKCIFDMSIHPYLSRTKEVDLTFPYCLFSHFYFLSNLFSFILFLELGLGLG